MSVTPDEVRTLLRYEPETGKLYWLPRYAGWSGFNALHAGKEAFTAVDSGGYRIGSIKDKRYRAHRVVWAIVHGEWPDHIDHINGDRQDNRIENLRSVTSAENRKNTKRYARNSTGVVGVKVHRDGGYSAYIGTKHLGHSKDFEAAVAMRKAAEIANNYHINHGR